MGTTIPETSEDVKKEKGIRKTKIELKTRAELAGMAKERKYSELLADGSIINSQNALESARVRYEGLMSKAKDKKEIEELERQFRQIERNLTVKIGGPLNAKGRAMVTV